MKYPLGSTCWKTAAKRNNPYLPLLLYSALLFSATETDTFYSDPDGHIPLLEYLTDEGLFMPTADECCAAVADSGSIPLAQWALRTRPIQRENLLEHSIGAGHLDLARYLAEDGEGGEGHADSVCWDYSHLEQAISSRNVSVCRYVLSQLRKRSADWRVSLGHTPYLMRAALQSSLEMLRFLEDEYLLPLKKGYLSLSLSHLISSPLAM